MLKKLSLAVLGLAASAPVLASPPHWAHSHRHPAVRYYPVAPVVVRPYVAPRYYYVPPRPAPVLTFRFDFPL